MELRWLEDFITVVNTGNFTKASEQLFISKSALTRHIKSLEAWVEAPLLNRSTHPISPTAAGEQFLKLSREIVRLSYEARASAKDHINSKESKVTIAGLHTMVLYRVPELVQTLHNKLYPFQASVISETKTIDEYIHQLYNGTCDFFICYNHPYLTSNIDSELFPHINIGVENIKPYQSTDQEPIDLDHFKGEFIPYLSFANSSFISSIIDSAIRNAPFYNQLRKVYEASLAESLFTATQKGLGLSWLPDTTINNSNTGNRLIPLSDKWNISLKISIFRSQRNNRPIINDIWNYWDSIKIDSNPPEK